VEKLPTIATARWNFNSKMITRARVKRGRLAIFFQNIFDGCEDWDPFYMLQDWAFKHVKFSKHFPS